jgi:hypothetical protein
LFVFFEIDIQEVLDLDGEEANYEMTYIHDDLYKIQFNDLDYSTTIEMDAQFMKLIDNGYIRLKGSTWFSNHIDYGFFDYDKDGIDELVTRRNIYYGAVDWLPNIYTFYEYNDKIKVKVYDMHFEYKKVWQY